MNNQKEPDLNEFKKKIDLFKNKFIKKKQGASNKFNRLTPFKVLVDIISGIAVGGFLGYILDVYLDTLPFLFFILTIFGMIGGVYNVYKDLDINKED